MGARWAVVAGALVVFAGVGAVLIFGNQGPPPQQRLFQLSVVGTTMTPSHVQAYANDTLTVSVVTDKAEEIHLHGYNKAFFPSPGQPVTLTFPADITGSFALEIEGPSIALGILDVQPRSGLLGLGGSSQQTATTVHPPAGSAGALIQVGSTASYNLSVQIGGLQPMYTPQQVASSHPKTGEVMFSGQMVMPPGMAGMADMSNMAGMSIPPEWHHLEVHAFSKKTGDVVKSLTPAVSVTSHSTGLVTPVPLTTMQGVIEGAGDFHYGNNVDLPPGLYTVTVVIGGETAAFDFNV
jgi:hypothetical protein